MKNISKLKIKLKDLPFENLKDHWDSKLDPNQEQQWEKVRGTFVTLTGRTKFYHRQNIMGYETVEGIPFMICTLCAEIGD